MVILGVIGPCELIGEKFAQHFDQELRQQQISLHESPKRLICMVKVSISIKIDNFRFQPEVRGRMSNSSSPFNSQGPITPN